MAALVEVVNEAIGITEVVILEIENLNELNDPRLPEEFYYPPTIFIEALNIPSIEDDCCPDPFWYGSVARASGKPLWRGGIIEVSYDDNLTWTKRADYVDESLTGVTVHEASGDQNLGTAIPDRWDVFSQVTVEMTSGGFLRSRTRDEVLAGANTLLINGEIRAFSTAVEIDPVDAAPYGLGQTFVLTDWIRGMRGTTIVDPAIPPEPGSDALVRSLVVDLNGPLTKVLLPIGDDELVLQYRARDNSSNFEIDSDEQGIEATLTGENLKPRPVIDASTIRQTNNDWIIDWTRVSRNPCTQILSARGASDDDTPATFEVRILDAVGGNLVRTLTTVVESTSTDQMLYPASAQVVDFGSIRTEIFVEIIRTTDWADSDTVEA